MTCPSCAHDNEAEARFCSRCGAALQTPGGPEANPPRPKEGRNRRKLLAAAAILGALLLGGIVVAIVALGGDDGPEPAQQVVDRPEPVDVPEDPIDAPTLDEDLEDLDDLNLASETVSVGETAEDDGAIFEVTSLEVVDSIALGEFTGGSITPAEGAQLVQAEVTWENDTSAPIDPFCGGGSATLLDTEDRNFDPTDDTIDIAGNETCGEAVQPGFKQDITLAFQLPDEAEIGGLALWNASDDVDIGGGTFVLFTPP
jgi:hypothetical protein